MVNSKTTTDILYYGTEGIPYLTPEYFFVHVTETYEPRQTAATYRGEQSAGIHQPLTSLTHSCAGMKSLLFILVTMLDTASGYSSFQALIPNGDRVSDPCDSSSWQGVGHWAKGGGGARNPFGEAFQQSDRVWTRALCMADSDGDGQSNGVELGDPGCVWTRGATPTDRPTGHPGICENWRTPLCRTRNSNLFNCASTGLQCPAISAQGVQQKQFRMPRTTIPATAFSYMCVNLEFPTDRDYHIIADTGILDNQNAVHHMILFACSTGVTAAELQHAVGRPYPCEMLPDSKCRDIITGWQPGIPGFCHPGHIGFSVGASRVRYATLQVVLF
ncbi:Temptin [Mizuhopecten yessoensis]|uniref:Temptin n=1 Tax=Mizuhopecten yessoensis TaxID=6573 RepID=A0A210QFM3_MIZYE|nr:Temptin [Mizuhopecten yessoensis]